MSVCLVTGGTHDCAVPIGVFLLNVKNTLPWVDHVIILHDGFSKKEILNLQKILPVEFIRYKFPGKKGQFNEIIKYYYREMVFCKFECFRFLSRFDCVVWSDYDVVFLDSCSELLENTVSGIRILMYRPDDPHCLFKSQLRAGTEKKFCTTYNVEQRSVATGLFVLTSALNKYPDLYNECIKLTEQYGEYLAFPDQAVFNMVLQKYKLTPESIPWIYACHPVSDADLMPQAKILHAYAQPKFWNGLKNATWEENYKKWIEISGISYRKTIFSWFRKKMCSLEYRIRHFRGK